MKKIIFPVCIVLIALLALPQTSKAQTEYKLDSIQHYNDILQLAQRTHYTYDNGGIKASTDIDSVKVSGIWSPKSKTTRTFNGDSKLKMEIYHSWDAINLEWSNISRIDYEYDEFQNNTVQNYYSHDGTSWIFNTKITYEFNENNQITTSILEFSDPIYMISIKNRAIYTYENGNNTIIEFDDWTSTSGQWVNNQKTVISYSGNLITQQDTFIWSGGPDWPLTPQSRQIYDYTTNDVYNITYQSDSGSGLMNIFKYNYTYNGNKLLGYVSYDWDNGWKENSKANVSYDINENFEEANIYVWDDISNYWAVSNKFLYFWSEAEPFALGTSFQELLFAKIYPNPASDIITVKTLSSVKTVELYDTLGKLVLTTNKSTIKVDGLQNGIYVLKIKTDNGQITKRIVIK
ncbi:T9SS type A sorting domain-containing protein [Flavobacteriaceae bacterium LMO-SS05]